MRRIRSAKPGFSELERRDLFKSWLVVSLVFSIAVPVTGSFFFAFVVSAFTVGLGFVVHELAHKLVAVRYGAEAEYRANDLMLFFALILSLAGVVFAAPGAVVIRGFLSRKERGLVSAAGPFANIVLGFVFFLLSFFSSLAVYGLMINSWLALFNLIPFLGLDGQKVLSWDKKAYALLVFLSFLLLFLSF